ncbi:MAG: hypothetical protein J3K34DRAFT_422357 [Monoraphidium minutum]|nr:MAG: hypothetical protein J3K34DRAFT_422357 [Monoraphidium minutum]
MLLFCPGRGWGKHMPRAGAGARGAGAPAALRTPHTRGRRAPAAHANHTTRLCRIAWGRRRRAEASCCYPGRQPRRGAAPRRPRARRGASAPPVGAPQAADWAPLPKRRDDAGGWRRPAPPPHTPLRGGSALGILESLKSAAHFIVHRPRAARAGAPHPPHAKHCVSERVAPRSDAQSPLSPTHSPFLGAPAAASRRRPGTLRGRAAPAALRGGAAAAQTPYARPAPRAPAPAPGRPCGRPPPRG